MAKTGINDLWTTRPDVATLLEDESLGYIYSKSSVKRVNFICPTCKERVSRQINSIVQSGFRCPYCSWEKSFGEKILRRILIALEADYTPEKSFKWSNHKRYDFYLTEFNIIIEVHGKQHYSYTGLSERTLEEERLNDKWKHDRAIENGITEENYIVIDARNTSLVCIKNQILSSVLSKYFNLNNFNWEECYKLAFNSIMKETCQLWNETNNNAKTLARDLKLSVSTVIRYLNIGYEIGLCKKYNWKEVDNDHAKKIICLTTNEIFDSMADAETKYNVTLINGNCNGRYSYRGELNNKPLVWMLLDDYNNSTDKEIKERINNAYKHYYRSSVVCLNTRKIFYDVNDALEYANIKTAKSIFNCCNGKSNSCGRDNNGIHLIWVHYTDYLNMSESEIKYRLDNIKFNSYRKVVCLNNKKVFNTMKEACAFYNLNMGNLCDTINKSNRKYCGKDLKTDECLEWMYYEDYIKKFGEVV